VIGDQHTAFRSADLYAAARVTDTVFLGRGAAYVESALKTLSAAGVQIALADFGTGYASLLGINHFPVYVLKTARSFIKNIEKNAYDAAIVQAVIKLGRSLKIKIVAKGVETSAQATFLRKQRCHTVQGYLYGKPAPRSEIPALTEIPPRRSKSGFR
jgi:EAL domain-containing protein (putative c-di-GMP-specific phosphodiesterase class I)